VRPQLLLVDPEQRNDPPVGLRGHLASLLRSEDLASVVLDHFPLGRGLDTATEDALVSIGLPRAAAGTVVHAMAVARTASDPQRVAPRIDSPEAMAAWLHRVKHVQHLETEHMWVCSLDAAHRLLEVRAVAAGSLTRVEAHMRDIFTPLLRVRAAACYLAHNHPSGEMRASVHDIRTAQRVDATARLFEIAMVDAMIVGPDGSFLSFRREGLL
jgi:DNA repair protein RadC